MKNTISMSWPAAGANAKSGPVPLALNAAQKLLLPVGVLLFDYLFWQQGSGANVLMFTVFVLGGQLLVWPAHAAARRSGRVGLAAAGCLVSAVAVAVYGSGAAVLASWVSLAVLLGFANQPHLRLVLFAGLTGLGSAARAGARVLHGLRLPAAASGAGVRRGWFYGRLAGLPLLALGAFHGLFAAANPRYDAWSGRALEVLGEWLARLWPDVSLAHLLFSGGGFLVVAGALVAVPIHAWADREGRLGEFVRRQRDRVASLAVRRPDFAARSFRALDLRKEWLIALAVCGLVNALLLVVNAIDVQWLWFGFVPPADFNLAQFVHEGTWVLIFSILLAMGIVLWFFRRNLNFYAPGRRPLQMLATAWVLQNAVLAVSVGLRNYYYIHYSGLAYKRIGVVFFLVLVLFGLGTVLLKIWQRRSAFGLVRLNAWAAYAVLLALAVGNWEVWIARYNLQPRFAHIDVGFLLDMPGRVLPTLLERRAVLGQRAMLTTDNTTVYQVVDEGGGSIVAASNDVLTVAQAQALLNGRVADWQAAYAAQSGWQSRCYADWQAYRQLLQITDSTPNRAKNL